MKLSLVVMTSGNAAGKSIAIPVSKFLIGREPGCHLRPASSLVSKRHCALISRDSKVFVQDFDSTNGTLVNNVPVKGEKELQNKDRLKIGPLLFEVRIEATTPVSKPTPPPPTRKAEQKPKADEEAAAMLLSLDEGGPPPGSEGLDSQGIPTGSTVFETGALPTPPPETQETVKETTDEKKPEEKKEPEKPKMGDTSVAAQAILEKYLKRPRS